MRFMNINMESFFYLSSVYGIFFVLVGCPETNCGPSILQKNQSLPFSKLPGLCPQGFYEHRATRSCYKIVPEAKTWFDARDSCAALGADLIWIESKMEYRHIAIKLLTNITTSKDNSNVGYWTAANDILDEKRYFWGDTDKPVMDTFFPTRSQDYTCRAYCSSRSRKIKQVLQKHCVVLTYIRAAMRMAPEEAECDDKRRYICKCKTEWQNEFKLCNHG